MRLLIAALFFFVSATAFSQQGSPEVQSLQSKLMQEINGGLQCTAQAIMLQQQVTKLTADLVAMKDKYEPKDK